MEAIVGADPVHLALKVARVCQQLLQGSGRVFPKSLACVVDRHLAQRVEGGPLMFGCREVPGAETKIGADLIDQALATGASPIEAIQCLVPALHKEAMAAARR